MIYIAELGSHSMGTYWIVMRYRVAVGEGRANLDLSRQQHAEYDRSRRSTRPIFIHCPVVVVNN